MPKPVSLDEMPPSPPEKVVGQPGNFPPSPMISSSSRMSVEGLMEAEMGLSKLIQGLPELGPEVSAFIQALKSTVPRLLAGGPMTDMESLPPQPPQPPPGMGQPAMGPPPEATMAM